MHVLWVQTLLGTPESLGGHPILAFLFADILIYSPYYSFTSPCCSAYNSVSILFNFEKKKIFCWIGELECANFIWKLVKTTLRHGASGSGDNVFCYPNKYLIIGTIMIENSLPYVAISVSNLLPRDLLNIITNSWCLCVIYTE